jgi:hypothetical protein
LISYLSIQKKKQDKEQEIANMKKEIAIKLREVHKELVI